VHKDAAGTFADVLDARLLLESIVSQQDMASGGAGAFKSVAETFGRHAAGIEAAAAAAAAEEARLAALAAQSAAMEIIRLAAAETPAPRDDAVPAFTLLSEAPALQAPGSVSEVVTDQAALPAAESDPPVGWRVPQAPPVEETLPTSPLLQIDAPATAADLGDFIEEVLDLTGLAGDDDGVAEAAAAAPAVEHLAALAPPIEPLTVPDPVAPATAWEPAEAGPPAEPLAVTEAVVAESDVSAAEAPALPSLAIEPAASVAAALAALEAETPPPPPPKDALPEWRLLADPVGAAAPTIDVVEPTETLEDLVAEFAATTSVPSPRSRPAPAGEDEIAVVAEPPAAMLSAAVSVLGVPTEFSSDAAESVAPAEAETPAAPATLEVVLGLQQAQAAAQAAVEEPREPVAEPPDLAAWSFVEELVHRDPRFEPRTPVDEPVAAPAAEDAQTPAGAVAPAMRATQPSPEVVVPKLPADWFIEVGRRQDQPVERLPVRAIGTPQDEPAPAHAEAIEHAPPTAVAAPAVPAAMLAAPPALPVLGGEEIENEPVQRRTVRWSPDPEPESGGSGPVFPRLAPSVQRVRAEARRRRWARIGSALSGSLASIAGSVASGVGAAASGAAALAGGLGRAGVSATRLVATALRAVGAGALAAIGAAGRGAGALVRATGAGVAAAARGVVSALTAAGRAAGALLKGLGALLAAGARSAAIGAATLGKALVSASTFAGRAAVRMSAAAGRGSAAGLRLAAGAIRGGASAAGAGVVSLSRALASGAGILGRFGLTAGSGAARAATRAASVAGKGVGRAAVTVPRRIYFVVSDAADRLPKPIIRPSYLGAALLVIVAVAGVPYAKVWISTYAPELRARLVESTRPVAESPVPAEPPRLPAAPANGTGSVRVTVDPEGADVLLDGMLQGAAPLTIENLKAGVHTLVVRNDSGTVRQSVRVTAGQAADVSLRIRPGWLAVFAPVKLEVHENGKPIGSTEGGRILAAAGPHTIEVVSQAIGFRETRQVEIKPGEVAAVTLDLPPATVEVAAPADAEILVDGQSVGVAPFGPLQIAVGTREFVMRHPTLGERRQVVTVTYNGPARVSFE
jgi:hypothetical protein